MIKLKSRIKYVVAFLQIIFFLFGCTKTSSKGESQDVEIDSVTVSKTKSEVIKEKPKKEVIKVEKVIPEGRCDLTVVLSTKEKLENLTNDDVHSFLFTFSEDCKDNVEFGEFGNEVLFEVVLNYTDVVSASFENDSIYQDVILKELANPIAEMPNMDEIIESIGNLQIEEQAKQDIIRTFKATLGYQ